MKLFPKSWIRAVWVAVVLCVAGGLRGAVLPKDAKTFLGEHCLDCHDDVLTKGGLNLADLPFDPQADANFRIWKRVFERVRDDEMPPKKKPRPDKQAAGYFLSALKAPLLEADRSDIAKRGRVNGRRLTRIEYEHTVHDLLGIDIPLKDLLPEDGMTHGFETVADGQQLSHHQLARYLDVADIALDEAFNRALKPLPSFKREHSPEQLAKRTGGNYRGPELRGGESITWPITLQFFGRVPVTTIPADGWYRITLREVRAINPGSDGAVWGTLRSGECKSSAPMLYMIGLVEAAPKPRDLAYEAWIRKGHMLELKPNDAEKRRAPTGARGGNVSFKGRDLKQQGFAGIAHKGIAIERIFPVADQAEVRRNLFGNHKAEDVKSDPAAALDERVGEFARRAFRRPVTDRDLAAYRELGRQALDDGESPIEALRISYRAILCSPRFLTFIEAPGRLDDHAIASRLSYALWVSMPDRRLARLAGAGKLSQPDVLAGQIERMLADPKAARFIASFTDQWLKLKEIDFTAPDRRLYRTFDPVVQDSMVAETRAYVEELIRENLGVSHLVDSDFAFLNGRLARHYEMGVSDIKPGAGLQKIALKSGKDDRRGGLVTQGAVLKVTADGTTTSPVIRGVFVNERILGQHLAPPPPGVPAIEPDIRGATSIRDQLDKHRSNPSCNVCHTTIDPPGLALESFDPVGQWRTNYGRRGKGAEVNPAGETPDGKPFSGLIDWKRIYAQRGGQLARGFVRHFLTYATGAPMRLSDEETVDAIVERTAESGHGLRTLMIEALSSPVFLNK